MPGSTTVCVIEDGQYRQTLADILEFIECHSVLQTDTGHWLEDIQKAGSADILLLGQCANADKQIEVFRQIKEWDHKVPILLLVDESRKAKLLPEVVAGTFKLLDILMDVLKFLPGTCHIYRIRKTG